MCFVEHAGETFPVTNLFSKTCHFDIIFLNVTTHKNLLGTSCNYQIFILYFHCHFSMSPIQKPLLFTCCTQYYVDSILFYFTSYLDDHVSGCKRCSQPLKNKTTTTKQTKPHHHTHQNTNTQNYEYPEVSTYNGKSKYFTKKPHNNHCYA